MGFDSTNANPQDWVTTSSIPFTPTLTPSNSTPPSTPNILAITLRRGNAAALLALLLLAAPVALAQAPAVSNAAFVQQDNGAGGTEVVITYDLDAAHGPWDLGVRSEIHTFCVDRGSAIRRRVPTLHFWHSRSRGWQVSPKERSALGTGSAGIPAGLFPRSRRGCCTAGAGRDAGAPSAGEMSGPSSSHPCRVPLPPALRRSIERGCHLGAGLVAAGM